MIVIAHMILQHVQTELVLLLVVLVEKHREMCEWEAPSLPVLVYSQLLEYVSQEKCAWWHLYEPYPSIAWSLVMMLLECATVFVCCGFEYACARVTVIAVSVSVCLCAYCCCCYYDCVCDDYC